MSFEDRFRSTVDQALGSLVQQLLEQAALEREETLRAAKASIFEEAEQATQARVTDAEARLRATVDEKIAQPLDDDRDAAAREIRKQLEVKSTRRCMMRSTPRRTACASRPADVGERPPTT